MLGALCCFIVLLGAGCSENLAKKSPIASIQVESIEGGEAHLPCDISSRHNDSVYLVLWYRKDSGTPIYSYDSRTGDPNNPGLWSEPNAFGQRAHFDINLSPAILSLSALSADDSGSYTCRVDYTQSPTDYKNIFLKVIVPPRSLVIMGDRGTVYKPGDPVGPLTEGQSFTTVCKVAGGDPAPGVVWYRGNQIYDKTFIGNELGVVQNTLSIQRLSREDIGVTYRCRANNNNITAPLQSSIKLDIMFPPLGARIISEDRPLLSGKEYSLACISWGSLPSSHIAWFRKHKNHQGMIPVTSDKVTVSSDGNVTTSWIRLLAKPEYNGQLLHCRGSNYKLEAGEFVEDSRTISVFFKPNVEIRLGRAVNPRDLEEGDDLYFECHVVSNPPPHRVLWRHNGIEVKAYQEGGTIIANQSLVIQKVKKENSGNYSCEAVNVEGSGISTYLNIAIMYKPSCSTNQKKIYGVSERETAHISCKVDSYPLADTFYWTLNTSLGDKDIQDSDGDISNLGGSSLLSYKPTAKIEFGTILCYGKNVVGKQSTPCVFHVIPAGPPDRPDDCQITNQSTMGIRVTCQPGFDGGLPQRFHLEVIGALNHRVLFNESRDLPNFWLSGLEPGTAIYIRISAENRKGQSPMVMIQALTSVLHEVNSPVMKEEGEQGNEKVPIFMVVVAGCILTAGVLGIGLGITLHCLAPVRSVHALDCRSSKGLTQMEEEEEHESPDLIQHIFTEQKQDGSQVRADTVPGTTSIHSSDSSGFSDMAGSSDGTRPPLFSEASRSTTAEHQIQGSRTGFAESSFQTGRQGESIYQNGRQGESCYLNGRQGENSFRTGHQGVQSPADSFNGISYGTNYVHNNLQGSKTLGRTRYGPALHGYSTFTRGNSRPSSILLSDLQELETLRGEEPDLAKSLRSLHSLSVDNPNHYSPGTFQPTTLSTSTLRRGQAQPFPRSGGEQRAEYLSSWGGVGGDRGGNLDCRSGWGGERVLAASGNISPLMESDRESCV